jgi:hypothetical protein
MSKALIKDTQQILNIENEYGVFYTQVSFEIKLDDGPLLESLTESQKFTHSTKKQEGNWFLLSDGKEYHQDELVVGQEEIREYQLNKIV